jgi:hypothetical protein
MVVITRNAVAELVFYCWRPGRWSANGNDCSLWIVVAQLNSTTEKAAQILTVEDSGQVLVRDRVFCFLMGFGIELP